MERADAQRRRHEMINIEHRPRGSSIVLEIANTGNAAATVLIDRTPTCCIDRRQRAEQRECFHRQRLRAKTQRILLTRHLRN